MQSFEYADPASVKEAVALLGGEWGEVDILAGGTDQISLMKEYIHKPRRVVNVKKIHELHGIGRTPHGLRIGAAVTFDELSSNAAVRSEYPSLTAAVLGITSPQIRNMGTVAGDLCQRPRCWFYRNGFGLLAMKDGKSLVPNGDNRYHAIFPKPPAYFVSASSLGPALIALNAQVKIASPSGTRTLPVEEFFVVPQDENSREIALKPNEIVTEIIVPSASGVKNATYEVRQKEALDWPLSVASVAMHMTGGKVSHARVVLGHVGPTPVIAHEAEVVLNGKALNDNVIEQAAEAAVKGAQPLKDNGYKVQLTRVAVKRALATASGKA